MATQITFSTVQLFPLLPRLCCMTGNYLWFIDSYSCMCWEVLSKHKSHFPTVSAMTHVEKRSKPSHEDKKNPTFMIFSDLWSPNNVIWFAISLPGSPNIQFMQQVMPGELWTSEDFADSWLWADVKLVTTLKQNRKFDTDAANLKVTFPSTTPEYDSTVSVFDSYIFLVFSLSSINTNTDWTSCDSYCVENGKFTGS